MIVRFAQVDRLIGKSGERGHPVWAPASLADRRKFRGGGKSARVGGRVDHRRNDAFGAEIERTRNQRKIANRHAHYRRGPALADRGDAGQKRAYVPETVLTFQRDRWKSFATDGFCKDRIGQAAPAAEHGFSGAQPAG